MNRLMNRLMTPPEKMRSSMTVPEAMKSMKMTARATRSTMTISSMIRSTMPTDLKRTFSRHDDGHQKTAPSGAVFLMLD